MPARISGVESRLYDLIVRRFFATFGDDAILEEREATVEVNEVDLFRIRVSALLEPGWTEYYRPYSYWKTRKIPEFQVKDEAVLARVDVEDRFTSPPERYTASKLIAYMERQGLGTKSTRAEIIENLYRRGYIEGREIRVTELGFAVVGILRRFFPELISVDMTSSLEEQMEDIESGRKDWREVIAKAVDSIKPVFDRIITRYEEVGEGLQVMDQFRKNLLGACPKCKSGFMRIVRSKKTGKRFVGCSNYPDICNFSCPIPQRGKVVRSEHDCKECGCTVVEVREGWRRWRFCVNEGCPSKKRQLQGLR